MGAGSADQLLHAGREALAAADWDRARSCFETALDLGESAELLDGLSQAVHFQGGHERAIELKERAFAAYRRRGRRIEAAELARWLAFLPRWRDRGGVGALDALGLLRQIGALPA